MCYHGIHHGIPRYTTVTYPSLYISLSLIISYQAAAPRDLGLPWFHSHPAYFPVLIFFSTPVHPTLGFINLSHDHNPQGGHQERCWPISESPRLGHIWFSYELLDTVLACRTPVELIYLLSLLSSIHIMLLPVIFSPHGVFPQAAPACSTQTLEDWPLYTLLKINYSSSVIFLVYYVFQF